MPPRSYLDISRDADSLWDEGMNRLAVAEQLYKEGGPYSLIDLPNPLLQGLGKLADSARENEKAVASREDIWVPIACADRYSQVGDYIMRAAEWHHMLRLYKDAAEMYDGAVRCLNTALANAKKLLRTYAPISREIRSLSFSELEEWLTSRGMSPSTVEDDYAVAIREHFFIHKKLMHAHQLLEFCARAGGDSESESAAYVARMRHQRKRLLYDYRMRIGARPTVLGKLVLLTLWEYTCLYGESWMRWAGCGAGIVLFFGFLYLPRPEFLPSGWLGLEFLSTSATGVVDALYMSLGTFTGFGTPNPANQLTKLVVAAEATLGYCMLGALVTLIVRKLTRSV